MTDYVLGLAFSPDNKKVLLIEKKTPAWQAGFMNGLGGKVEYNDRTLALMSNESAESIAMAREFKEECGIQTKASDWTLAGIMYNNSENWKVSIFKCICPNIEEFKTMESEIVMLIPVSEAVLNVKSNIRFLSNIPWLIQLCLSPDSTLGYFEIEYERKSNND